MSNVVCLRCCSIFAIIFNLMGGVFTQLGFPTAFDVLPTCTDTLISENKNCIPAFGGVTSRVGDPNLDAFSLFRDSLAFIFKNPIGNTLFFLPKVILFVGATNPALIALAGIFTVIFAMSTFFFLLQWMRGVGIEVFKAVMIVVVLNSLLMMYPMEIVIPIV